MIDERTVALASRYVLGNVSAEERRDFEAALRSDARLQLLVRELRGTQGAGPTTSGRTDSSGAAEGVRSRTRRETPGPSPKPTPKTSEWLLWTAWLLSTCFAAVCVLLVFSDRIQREKTADLARKWEEESRELTRLRRENLALQKAAADQATHYQQRAHTFESNLRQGLEQLNLQTAALTNQLEQQLGLTTRELEAARKEVAELSNAKIALEQAVATLGARERDRFKTAKLLTLRPASGPDSARDAAGAVLWCPGDQHGLLSVQNLRPLPATQTYQLWLVETKMKPAVSGGLFSSSGRLQGQFTPKTRIDSLERVFLTIESAVGAKTPSERSVLSGE